MKPVEKSVPEVLAQPDLSLAHGLITHLRVSAPADLLGTFDIAWLHFFATARTSHIRDLL